MDPKKFPFRLRASGWIVSLAGATMIVFSGGWTEESKVLFIAGCFGMVGGMVLTSLSSLVNHLQYMKGLRKPSDPKGPTDS